MTSYLFLGQQLIPPQVPLKQQATCHTAPREVGEVEPAAHPLGGSCVLGMLAVAVRGEVEGMGPPVPPSSAGLEQGEGDHLVQECCRKMQLYYSATAHSIVSTITEYRSNLGQQLEGILNKNKTMAYVQAAAPAPMLPVIQYQQE